MAWLQCVLSWLLVLLCAGARSVDILLAVQALQVRLNCSSHMACLGSSASQAVANCSPSTTTQTHLAAGTWHINSVAAVVQCLTPACWQCRCMMD
ncbi:hypothetical protein COO60DRAFT_1479381 [Scenedesmus sp. NREL 46B-D3]|nr:hypothetical protein COO60DRAFT_1479381 [Scenedesmus sp. NREL 46B-D3]